MESRSLCCARIAISSHLVRSKVSVSGYSGDSVRTISMDKLWRKFFSDPSEWWDHRSEKVNPRYPDFKHKTTHDGLWVNESNPPWVKAELAAIAPGVLRTSSFAWNKKLGRYVKAREYGKTIESFVQMQREGIYPDKFTFVSVLNACSSLRAIEQGRHIHLHIIRTGHESDVYVGSCLVDMYAKCGRIEDAWRVFNKMPMRNVVSWTAIILGYVKCGQGLRALELYREMKGEGVQPNPVTFVAVLSACAGVVALDEGKRVHEQIAERGYESDVFVGSTLVDMYAKCGSIEDAWAVFSKMPMRNVVSWTAMILGYVTCGQGQKALELSRRMYAEEVKPNRVTFVGLVNACAKLAALEEGRLVHEQVIRRGYETDVFLGNCLVNMYAKCGSIEDACTVFKNMRTRDVVSWNAMILGYVRSGHWQKALELFRQMHDENVEPNNITFLGLLKACASLMALEEGQGLHEQIIRRGYESDIFVGNSLVDMYAKCGSIMDAWRVFNKMTARDVVSWDTMLEGFTMHGHVKDALRHFESMCQQGIQITAVTFVSLLSACSHAGLVDEGLNYFESMRVLYNISATVDHYTCVVDLLGRAGRVFEAEDLIKTIRSCEPDARLWMSLLGACRLHVNVELGERVSRQVLQMDPDISPCYVLLANIYAAAGRWDSSAALQQERLKYLVKSPGCDLVNWNNELYSLIGDDKNLKQWKQTRSSRDRASR